MPCHACLLARSAFRHHAPSPAQPSAVTDMTGLLLVPSLAKAKKERKKKTCASCNLLRTWVYVYVYVYVYSMCGGGGGGRTTTTTTTTTLEYSTYIPRPITMHGQAASGSRRTLLAWADWAGRPFGVCSAW